MPDVSRARPRAGGGGELGLADTVSAVRPPSTPDRTASRPVPPRPALSSGPPAPERSRPLRSLIRMLSNGLAQTGEMTALLGVVLRSAVGRPSGYWGDVRDQMFAILKLCWIPMVLSTFAFGLGAPGLQALNLFSLFGVPERLGSLFVMASVREFAPRINSLVIAGVIGTAITADLGARRIREEIDALEVLGVDVLRTLVLPRVLAVCLMTALLDLVALSFGVVGGFIAAVPIGGATASAFVGNFFANATTTDLWASVCKSGLFGLIIGTVCCYKGLNAHGGPIGVGRAVNQAVVIAFIAIGIVNYVFTMILLGLNPQIHVFK